jgi:hypothetical protein
MLKAVIEAYPIDSVQDISEDPGVFDAKGRICGGEDLTLNEIEHQIIRVDFLEPRAHFAVNCASMGCPWLPQEPFLPEGLDGQLDHETRRFFGAPSHLVIDSDSSTVWLSPIMEWYEEDFLIWLEEERGVADPSVLDYVKLYIPEGKASTIDDDFEIKWLEYDWALTDANAEWGERPVTLD